MGTTRLLHRDALAIAESCGTLLRGCDKTSVALFVAQGDLSSLPWLELAISTRLPTTEQDETISRVRDGIDVLHALAQCPGYAPRLNAHAWEEILFSAGFEYREPGGHLIFDDAFPRVRLIIPSLARSGDPDAAQHEAEQVDRILRRFVRLDPSDRGSDSGSAHEALMARLKPFLPSGKVRPGPLEIALSLPSMDSKWLLPAATALCHQVHQNDKMKVVEIEINQSRFKPSDPLAALGWLEQLPGVATLPRWRLDESMEDAAVYGPFYRRLLGVDGNASGIQIQWLDVVPPGVDDTQLEVLCSALPFTRTIRGLRILVDDDWQWGLLDSEKNWAWLGYALFHEQTPASTWRALSIDGYTYRPTSACGLENVKRYGAAALGRYLDRRPHQHVRAIDSQVSRRVQCVSGAQLWQLRDRDDATATPYVELEESTEFEAIGFPVEGFQALVVPGVGMGHVRVDDIVSASAFGGPGLGNVATSQRRASLTSLLARLHEWGEPALDELSLIEVVRACGASLLSLEAIGTRPLVDYEIDGMLRACPNLTSLTIDHDGSYWTYWHSVSGDTTPAETFPKLTSLRQTCSLIEAFGTVTALSNAVQPVFPAVRDLTFDVTKGRSVFPSIAKALGAIVLANDTLESLTMVRDDIVIPSRKVASCERLRCPARLGLPSTFVEAPSHQENIQYKLGITLAMQPLWDALKRPLPTDVIQNILGYTGGVRKRHIWVDLA